ncbi:MAG: excinuclease ABC subunit UvrC [Patescibacteria group bacterium]
MYNVKSKIAVLLKTLPKQSGVYLMKDDRGRVIYVGKAKYLSNRVRSYFNRLHEEIKTRQLVDKIDDMEWIVTDSELEALMLETNLIKKYRPHYNVLMKDDKNYVYIKITKEDFPRVILVRKVVKDGGKYFGPYSNSTVVEESLRLLNRIFPFFTYKNKTGVSPMDSVAGKELFIKRSKSVWGYLSDQKIYNQMMADFVAFMRGKTKKVGRIFQLEMKQAAGNKEFERAAMLRDRMVDIEKILAKQKVITPHQDNLDVVGVYGENRKWIISLMTVRVGKMLSLDFFDLKGSNESEVVAAFLSYYYLAAQEFPAQVLLPVTIDEMTEMGDIISDLAKKVVKVSCPKKGYKKDLSLLASKNCKLEFMKRQAVVSVTKSEGLGLSELWRSLIDVGFGNYAQAWSDIEDGIFRIEGYDISNLGDQGVVGAMVVWQLKKNDRGESNQTKPDHNILIDELKRWKGSFNKKMYRRFAIKSFSGQDDFAALGEVLSRRFKRSQSEWPWPNLILIDGGKGQLSTVLVALKQNMIDIPVIGIAKKEEELWLGNISEDGEVMFKLLVLDKSSVASLFLQSIRNEAHRYVLSYQRLTRKKKLRQSILDTISGLGPRKKKMLLSAFGSVGGVVAAGEEVVGEVVGKKLAGKIFEVI